MYRIKSVGSSPLGLSRRLLAFTSLLLMAFSLLRGTHLVAQVAGEGAIEGTITDKSGARVPRAKVTATNTETGIAVTRESTSTGDYSISPLQPGNYNLEVVAKGFQRLLQENVQVNALSKIGVPLKVTVGGEDTTITITDAPPFLDTTNATLGGTIENELYTELPLSMGGGPRDPTAFQYLMPGVQEGGQPTGSNNNVQGVYGGTGQTQLNENYVEGVPVSNINSQGDNTVVSKSVSVDAVDQFQVQTSGASTSFGGAGVTNFTIKSGGNQFHGTVFDYVRNTIFDTWGYFAKVPSQGTGYANKPAEHQNSFGGSLSGPIFKDKLFFFASYEGFHYTKLSNTPQYITLPTLRQRTGDFTDVYGNTNPGIYDPSLSSSRNPFQGNQNGVPTFNVIPQNELSSISLYMQSALPAPTNLATVNNYLSGLPLENRDYSIDTRVDYTISARNKFSVVAIAGNQGFGGQPSYNTLQQLPKPYASGYYTNSKTASGILSYTFVASQSLINSLKYGYTRTWGERFSITKGTAFTAAKAGIQGLPQGNASDDMPAVNFDAASSGFAPFNWGSTPDSGPTATNTYTIIDSLQWIKGRHNFTFGLQIQWLETNQAGYGGFSDVLHLNASAYNTQGGGCPASAPCPGAAYASYLVGAYASGSVRTQAISDVGGRFRPDALYIQDDWRFSPKLTLNLGLRYDYLQPYHEVKNRLSFINTTKINPITGTPGTLEYAGFPVTSGPNQTPDNYLPYICHCTTPVHPYNWNFEPRLGFAYAAKPSFVVRGGFSIQLTHAGGAGGGSNSAGGPGTGSRYTGGQNYPSNGSTGVPSFFLNPAISPSSSVALYNPPQVQDFSFIPPWIAPGLAVSPLQSTGNYNFVNYNTAQTAAGIAGFTPVGNNTYKCGTNDGSNCNPGGLNYADPYYGGRGPQFINFNFGIQQMINKKAVLNINYAGSMTHFLPNGSGRGYATNNFSPDYDQLLEGTLGTGTALQNLQTVQAKLPNYKLPYDGFSGPGSTTGSSLTAFPQFGGLTDIWGDTGNSNYHSIQFQVTQRPWHNLSGFVNYTRQKSIDDTHGHRTQYGVGPQDGNFVKNYTANQVDRGLGSFSQTNAFNLTWVYRFPFGRGQAFFATNRIAGLIGGGWELSGIYQYRDGVPLHITNGGGCQTSSGPGLHQGTCFPDYAPGFDKRAARINGRWGRGPGATAANLQTIQYLNPAAFTCPDSPVNSPTLTCGTSSNFSTYKLGNIASSAPDNLYGPGWWALAGGVRRTFTIIERPTLHLTFQVEGDVINATNSTFFNLAGSATSWNNNCTSQAINSCNAYGTIGGQNQSAPVAPRDWQFAGRFRF